jgi:hypothetical protein
LTAQTDTFEIGRNGVTFRAVYEAFTIPDRFDVLYPGSRVVSTGGFSGSGTLNVTLPKDPNDPNDGEIIVAVYGPNPGMA